MDFLTEIANIAIYSVLGIIFMMLGNFLIDLIVPCHFPTEIKNGNQAVGWLSAGSFIAIGLILRTAIMSPSAEAVSETLISGILNTSLYFVLGVVFLILGYIVVSIFNKRYNLNEEIGNGNVAAGLMVFGIFIGLALVISGVIS